MITGIDRSVTDETPRTSTWNVDDYYCATYSRSIGIRSSNGCEAVGNCWFRCRQRRMIIITTTSLVALPESLLRAGRVGG